MTPKLEYDRKANAAYLRFSSEKIVESEEVSPGIVLDYDEVGHIIGMEILDADHKFPPTALQAA